MLWVCGQSKYVDSHSAGIDFIRHNLTSVDVRFCRLKLIPALSGLNIMTKLNYRRFVDMNIVGVVHIINSDLRIHRMH